MHRTPDREGWCGPTPSTGLRTGTLSRKSALKNFTHKTMFSNGYGPTPVQRMRLPRHPRYRHRRSSALLWAQQSVGVSNEIRHTHSGRPIDRYIWAYRLVRRQDLRVHGLNDQHRRVLGVDKSRWQSEPHDLVGITSAFREMKPLPLVQQIEVAIDRVSAPGSKGVHHAVVAR